MNSTLSFQRGVLIVHELVQCGVTDFFIAPGSRSTPLAVATTKIEKAVQHVFYDERSLGFTALGTAKSTQKPVAIITTSGTAVANLLPSVVEAFYDGVPLILLTSDRPFELQNTGANQSIMQKNIFSDYVEWAISLPCSDDAVVNSVFLSTVDMAVYRAIKSGRPIQLNCEFREPFLLSEIPSLDMNPYCMFNSLPKLPSVECGLILAGEMTEADSDAVLALSEQLGWVIVPDCMSELRYKEHPLIHPEYSFISEIKESVCVIQIGKRCLDTPFISALRKANAFWIMVSLSIPLNNPNHLCRAAFVGSIVDYCHYLSLHIPSHVSSFKRHLTPSFPTDQVNEASIFSLIPPSFCMDRFMFVSNSRVVRSFNLCAPKTLNCSVYVNRGTSGIDGIVSTAIGVAKGLNQKGILFIGDLSFCYDLNALGQLKESVPPLIIFVLNNQGGGIFRSLPIYKSISKHDFVQLFQTPHDAESFEHIAAHFKCEYRCVKTIDQLQDIYHMSVSRHMIVELVYDSEENEKVFNTMLAVVKAEF